MKILVDTNVILDVLFEREPFVAHSSSIMGSVERRTLNGILCATTLTTIHSLTCKTIGKAKGSAAIKKLLQIYQVAPVDQAILVHALDSGFNDFEDAVLYASAIQAGAEAIITRNTKDFRLAEIPIFTPEEFMVKKVAMVETLKR